MPTTTRPAPAAAPLPPTVRFDVQLISAPALAQYMQFRGFTVRSLAKHVGLGDKSWSTIGHLRSGRVKTCTPALARTIEKALDAPTGSLFVPRVTTLNGVTAPRSIGRRPR